MAVYIICIRSWESKYMLLNSIWIKVFKPKYNNRSFLLYMTLFKLRINKRIHTKNRLFNKKPPKKFWKFKNDIKKCWDSHHFDKIKKNLEFSSTSFMTYWNTQMLLITFNEVELLISKYYWLYLQQNQIIVKTHIQHTK